MAVQDFITNPNMQIGPDLLQDPAILDLLGQESVLDKVFDPSVFTPGTSLAGSVLPGDPFMQNITPDPLQSFIQAGIADNKRPVYSGTNLAGMVGPIATGQEYAKSIAGGMPFEQVVAPGMSFSPEFPMGYTQADLTAPVIPPIVDDGPTPPPIIDLPPPDAPPIDAPPIFLPTPLPQVITPDPIQYRGGTPGFDFRGTGSPFPTKLVPGVEKPTPPISIGGPGGLDVEGIRGLLQDIGFIQEAPTFDPTPLEERIRLLEQREIPMFDPSGLQQQIGGLQEQIGGIPQFDPSGLQEQITALQERPTFDPTDIRERIGLLETREMPQFDPSGIYSQIGGLQEQITGIPQFDPSTLQEQITTLQQRPGFDPSGLQEQIGLLQEQILNVPQFDPSDLQRQIDINRQIIGDIPTYDDAALRERLAVLENQQPMPLPEISITMPEPIYSALPVGPSIPFDPTKPPPPISIGGPGLGPVAPVVSAPVVTTPVPIVDQIVSPIRTGRSPVRAMPVGLMSR